MYNRKIKERFIKEYTTGIKLREACVALFNLFEKHEVEWGADLCTRSSDELTPVVATLVGMRLDSHVLRLRILRDYVSWCINQGIQGAQDGMLQVKIDGVENMRSRTVNSPLHLQSYLDGIYEPESEKTVDNTERCYLWLAFSGVAEEDIFKIKTDHVDFSNMTVRVGETLYPIYREAIPCFRNCVELSGFYFKRPNIKIGEYPFISRVSGDYIIRGIRAMPTLHSMRVSVSRRAKDKNGLRISYFRAWISGLFYRAYEREKAGFPIDFTEAAAAFTKNREYKDGTHRANTRRVNRGYLKDYEVWKLTFI